MVVLLSRALLTASLLVAASTATELSCPISKCTFTTPIPPKQDPWYTTPPRNIALSPPGTILRLRKAPPSLPPLVPNSSEAYHILYRTTDSQYQPTWAVATLFTPNTTTPAKGKALLSYQIAYDANDLNSSPSYTMYSSPPSHEISDALGRGWHVITADYEGPLASFTAGVMSGHAVLDGIRAALSNSCVAAFGFQHHGVRLAAWGYSGGALATEWAAEFQGGYAPELRFEGIAVGGLTPNVTSIRDTVEGTLSAGLIPAWLVGVSSQFPDVREYIVSRLKTTGPFNATTFLGIEDGSSTGADFVFQNISNYFKEGFDDLEVPIVQRIVDSDGIMGYHGVPSMPVYAYQAVHDELSPVRDVDKLIQRYCMLGADILYTRNTVGDHVGEFVTGSNRAISFLASVIEGTRAHRGCMTRTITEPAA